MEDNCHVEQAIDIHSTTLPCCCIVGKVHRVVYCHTSAALAPVHGNSSTIYVSRVPCTSKSSVCCLQAHNMQHLGMLADHKQCAKAEHTGGVQQLAQLCIVNMCMPESCRHQTLLKWANPICAHHAWIVHPQRQCVNPRIRLSKPAIDKYGATYRWHILMSHVLTWPACLP